MANSSETGGIYTALGKFKSRSLSVSTAEIHLSTIQYVTVLTVPTYVHMYVHGFIIMYALRYTACTDFEKELLTKYSTVKNQGHFTNQFHGRSLKFELSVKVDATKCCQRSYYCHQVVAATACTVPPEAECH